MQAARIKCFFETLPLRAERFCALPEQSGPTYSCENRRDA